MCTRSFSTGCTTLGRSGAEGGAGDLQTAPADVTGLSAYALLAASAFLSATLLLGSSEAVLLGLLAQGQGEPWMLVAAAGLGAGDRRSAHAGGRPAAGAVMAVPDPRGGGEDGTCSGMGGWGYCKEPRHRCVCTLTTPAVFDEAGPVRPVVAVDTEAEGGWVKAVYKGISRSTTRPPQVDGRWSGPIALCFS